MQNNTAHLNSTFHQHQSQAQSTLNTVKPMSTHLFRVGFKCTFIHRHVHSTMYFACTFIYAQAEMEEETRVFNDSQLCEQVSHSNKKVLKGNIN